MSPTSKRSHTRFSLSAAEKDIVTSIAAKFSRERERRRRRIRLMDFSAVERLLNARENEVAEKFLRINPRSYGIRGPLFGISRPPENLVAFYGQHYRSKYDGKEKRLPTQYLPRPASNALQALNDALEHDTGRKLLVLSGYRSPAYQLLLFLWYYTRNGYSVARTIRKVMLPGYSQHGHPKHTAVDFVTQDGTYFHAFIKTREYRWLRKNGKRFRFFESYPKNNLLGVQHEPWHWQFRSSDG